MTGVQFNTTVSILFVGYVLMQVPSNMLITRVKPGIYMSAWMLVWAVVSGCTALVQNFGGLVACRFFLGITEAPFYPGATYMLSIFYTRKGMWDRCVGIRWMDADRTTRGCYSHCVAVLCANSGDWILWTDRCWCLCWYGWPPRHCWMEVALHRVGFLAVRLLGLC